MQDESASVQVYVLNPCLVPIPRQMDQYLILTAACDHMLVSEDGTLTQSGSMQPFIAKSFQVQVPAGLNLQHRSVQDFAAKGCTTLKLRPREAGVAKLKVLFDRQVIHIALLHRKYMLWVHLWVHSTSVGHTLPTCLVVCMVLQASRALLSTFTKLKARITPAKETEA